MSKEWHILACSDLHLREDKPKCRVDDFQAAQMHALSQIHNIVYEHDVLVVCAGDVFHRHTNSQKFLADTMRILPKMYAIYGNHDLASHSYKFHEHSSFHVLSTAGIIYETMIPYSHNLVGVPFGLKPDESVETDVLTLHSYVYKIKPNVPIGSPAVHLFKKYPNVRCFITGDNHESFVIERDNRLLINPGCMTRQRASEKDLEPSVYLVNLDTLAYERIKLTINLDDVSTEHLTKKEQQNENLQSFVQTLANANGQAEEISFADNIERKIENSNIHVTTEEQVRRAIDEG